jgi:hypothetical protein
MFVIYLLMLNYQAQLGSSTKIAVYRWQLINKRFLSKQV